jgi:hypothetical protein
MALWVNSALSFIGRKSAACPKFYMVLQYYSPIPVGRRGVISSFRWFLPAFPHVEERGGSRHPMSLIGPHPSQPSSRVRPRFFAFLLVFFLPMQPMKADVRWWCWPIKTTAKSVIFFSYIPSTTKVFHKRWEYFSSISIASRNSNL